MKYQFLLGADDPEMKAIARILANQKARFHYATVDLHWRAGPGDSYRVATPIILEEHQLAVVECAYANMPSSTIVIDHHRPGDPGFSLGSDRFWEASSIGQLHALLGLEPRHDALVMAAFDHCFAAAVRGECPGVTTEEVIQLRVVEVSQQTDIHRSAVWERVTAFRQMLAQAPELTIGEQTVKDFRGMYLGEGYSFDYLSAQLAVVMNHSVALLRHRDTTRTAEKNTITGHATSDTIQTFITTWAPAHGLVRIFGVPERGYAGGYLAEKR